MNKLKMKAKAGVTLVELLVVILIVTILSVSMLPLLQPFVTEAQYAAEPIPVIGNLRTKIGLYMYDKGSLPSSQSDNSVQTWFEGLKVKGDATNVFAGAVYDLGELASSQVAVLPSDPSLHLGKQIDVDFQDLRGKRSNPAHYHYYRIPDTDKVHDSYVIGCFGDGNGLKAGTGYAVCEINFKDATKTEGEGDTATTKQTSAARKYLGIWKKYKTDDSGAIRFNSISTANAYGCLVPDRSAANAEATDVNDDPQLIKLMRTAGWEF